MGGAVCHGQPLVRQPHASGTLQYPSVRPPHSPGIPKLEQRSDEKWGDEPEYIKYKEQTPVLLFRLPRCSPSRDVDLEQGDKQLVTDVTEVTVQHSSQ